MKNKDLSAMPLTNGLLDNLTHVGAKDAMGLTKREMFAMSAMQAILSNGASEEIGYTDWDKNLANHAITAADALLKELDK